MTPRSIIHNTVDTSIRVLRLPADAANRVLGRRGLRLDAVEATVRETAGKVLRDDELRADGIRRRAAYDKRVEAEQLRAAAGTVADQADREADARKQQAAAKREQADETAQARKRAAAKQEQERKRQATERERERKAAGAKAAQERRKADEAEAKRARLRALDDADAALAEREKALVAEDEAERLKSAAGDAKAARKA